MEKREFLRLLGTLTIGTPFVLNGFQSRAMSQFLDFPINCDGIKDRVLVIVRLAGANDGLNTVIPISQYSTYAALRPDIKIKETGTGAYIPLDNTVADSKKVGLHPSMTGFKSLYDSGKLALVNGVGYPSPNYSHFNSEAKMFAGQDGTTNELSDGIFGKYLTAVFPGLAGNPSNDRPDPLAIQLGSTNPCLFYGHSHENSIEYNMTSLQTDLFGRLSRIIRVNSEHQEVLDYIAGIERSMDRYYNRVMAVFNAGTNSTVTYPADDLGKQLKTVARMIKGGSKTKIFQVNIGGFDTHGNQVQSGATQQGNHANLLASISNATSAFYNDLGSLGLENRVMTTTFSEFGRQVRQNGSLGTDHGDLSPFFVIGGNVEAGIFGDHPVFTDTTSFYYNQTQRRYDYRQIFATLMQDWLGANDYMMNQAQLNMFDKIPLIKNTANAAANGCLVGTLNSDIKTATGTQNSIVAISTQNNIAERMTNNIPNGDLVLEAKSKGLVITRMNTTQRDALTAIEGMLIYNTTENCYQLYNGIIWKCIERTN